MKNTLLLITFLLSFTGFSQVKSPQLSPLATLKQTVGLSEIEIIYSRPGKRNRLVFGELVPYGKIWRTGANANSTISFSDDVKINGIELKKGKYAIYLMPKAEAWIVYFYKDTENWGLPKTWDDTKVALKLDLKPEIAAISLESFTITIDNLTIDSAEVLIAWEKSFAKFKVEVPTNALAKSSIEKTLKGPTAGDYYSAANYLFMANDNIEEALNYINKSIDLRKDDVPYWYTRLKSTIQAKLGDKKGAIETAKISLAAAEKAENQDYIKMNKDSISEWSKK
ncbi:MAG: DUF2911 domain-containing protein [Flavobacterium sp.]|jgi:hypothetical protein